MGDQKPTPGPIVCPREGCGTNTEVNLYGNLRAHKLPDGWRTCAASGKQPTYAAGMEPPLPPRPALG